MVYSQRTGINGKKSLSITFNLTTMYPFTDHFGTTYDLDDPNTFDTLPKSIQDLREKMFAEIGAAILYMNYWHKDEYSTISAAQKQRVEEMIQEFADNERAHYSDLRWYQIQVFRFINETENMC